MNNKWVAWLKHTLLVMTFLAWSSVAHSGEIHEAAQRGDESQLLAYLNESPRWVDVKDDAFGMTPLHWAAFKGQKAAVELLLAKGAKVNAKSNAGKTALHYAAQEGYQDIAEILLAKGADANAKDEQGMTPASLAAQQLEGQPTKQIRMLRVFESKVAGIKAKDNAGQVVMLGGVAVEFHPVDASGKDNAGQAAMLGRGTDPQTSEVLDHLKVDPSWINRPDDLYGMTPLHWATFKGQKAVVELLLAKGASVKAKSKAGRTALNYAVVEGHLEIVTLLLAKGADVNEKDNEGTTPAHWASGNRKTIELLLAKGADVNAKDKEGKTPAHWAASQGHEQILKLLLESKGADSNIKDNAGRTALETFETEGRASLRNQEYAEQKARQNAAYRAEQAARGLVEWNGEWYTPQDAQAAEKACWARIKRDEELARQRQAQQNTAPTYYDPYEVHKTGPGSQWWIPRDQGRPKPGWDPGPTIR